MSAPPSPSSTSPPLPSVPPAVARSLNELGAAIHELGRLPRTSSSVSGISDASDAAYPAAPPPPLPLLPTVSTSREQLLIKQTAPSVAGLPPVAAQLFRVRDDARRKRYKVLHPGLSDGGGGGRRAPELLVVDAAGTPVWAVRSGEDERSREMRKPGSDYCIVLRRKHWAAYLPKRVEGVAWRHGMRRVVFVVKGDALGRRFDVHAGAEVIAQAQRSTQIVERGEGGGGFAAAVWKVQVAVGVDTALMTAVAAVLERWCVGVGDEGAG